jgi:hypothetical protein
MRRFLVLAAMVALFAAPMTARAAEPGMTFSVDSIQLVAKVVVKVDVTFTCQPRTIPDPPWRTWFEMPMFYLQIQQAVGRQQATAAAEADFDGDALCDGSPHSLMITAVADGSGPPFRKGPAAMKVSGYASYMLENTETWEQHWVSQYATTGWIQVKLGS